MTAISPDTLYLGDLSIFFTEDVLAAAIRRFGVDIVSVKICSKHGVQRKFGFVTFRTAEQCDKALDILQHNLYIHRRFVRVCRAGRNIVNNVPVNILAYFPHVCIYSVYVRFCSILGAFNEKVLIDHFLVHGILLDVSILELNYVVSVKGTLYFVVFIIKSPVFVTQ